MNKEPLTLDNDGVLRVPAIEASEIHLRNKAGECLGVMAADDSGVMLAMRDQSNAIRISLGVGIDGEAGILVNDRNGRPQIAVFNENGDPFIALRNIEGGIAVAVSLSDGLPVIHANEHKLPLHEILAALAQVAQARQPNASQN